MVDIEGSNNVLIYGAALQFNLGRFSLGTKYGISDAKGHYATASLGFKILKEKKSETYRHYYNLQFYEQNGRVFYYFLGNHEFAEKEKVFKNDWAVEFSDEKLMKELHNHLQPNEEHNVPLKRKGFENEITKDFCEYEHLCMAILYETIRLKLNLRLNLTIDFERRLKLVKIE